MAKDIVPVQLSGSNIADADSIPVHATTNDPGEDDTRDVRYVLQAFDYVHISTAKTETLTPAEFLHSITVNKAGEANSTITVYDGAVGLGKIIAVIDGTVNGTKTFNVDLLETSLVIVTTGSTTPPDVTVSYR